MTNSLVVRQFVQLARGAKVAPRRLVDAQVVRIVSVDNTLCQRCQHVGTHDLIEFSNRMTWQVCRVCFSVHENKVLTDFILDGGSVERYAL